METLVPGSSTSIDYINFRKLKIKILHAENNVFSWLKSLIYRKPWLMEVSEKLMTYHRGFEFFQLLQLLELHFNFLLLSVMWLEFLLLQFQKILCLLLLKRHLFKLLLHFLQLFLKWNWCCFGFRMIFPFSWFLDLWRFVLRKAVGVLFSGKDVIRRQWWLRYSSGDNVRFILWRVFGVQWLSGSLLCRNNDGNRCGDVGHLGIWICSVKRRIFCWFVHCVVIAWGIYGDFLTVIFWNSEWFA